MSILMPEQLAVWKKTVFIAEAVMAVSWLFFSISFARIDYWDSVSKFAKLLLLVSPVFLYFLAAVPTREFYYSPEFAVERMLFLEDIGYVFNLLILLYSVVSFINLEVTLRSSSGDSKWKIKYILMGTGGIIAMNIFYYSYALLYRSLNMALLPVRTGVVLVSVLLIGFSIFKHKALDVEINISRSILYKSLAVFIIGFYLLGLGIIGEGMRYLGPDVGRNITTFLGFAGAILILVILLSEQLRRKAIVFISKNFYSTKYDYREQWLTFTQRISLKHTSEELFESIEEGFKEAIGSRGASVWMKDKSKSEFHSVTTLDSSVINVKPDKELIEFFQEKEWILNVSDKKCKVIVEKNEDFIKRTDASLIVPFLYVNELIGFIILKEGLAGEEYNYEDYDLLKTLAKQATLAIMNTQLSEELTVAKEMEVIGRLSSFIIHDLKNAASMLTLIAQNAEEHIDNPVFQKDSMRAIANTSEKIKGIIEKLKIFPGKTDLELEYADLGDCVRSAITQLHINGNPRLSFNEIIPVVTIIDKEEMIKVIINMIINALDATGTRGQVKIDLGIEDSMAFIRISDNGCGMSAEFIEKKLFKPFQTTKKKGLGIGLYQCKSIVDAHSGRLTVASREGKGTSFIIYLPIIS